MLVLKNHVITRSAILLGLILTAGCGGGGGGGTTITGASPSTLPTGRGIVKLPPRFPLPMSSLQVLGPGGASKIGVDGTFTVTGFNPGTSLVTLADSANRPVLLGYVNVGRAGGEISVQQTAVALSYYATGAFTLPPNQRDRARAIVASSTAVAQLAAVIASRVVSDTTAVSDGDPMTLNAVQSACSALAPQARAMMAASIARRTGPKYSMLSLGRSQTSSNITGLVEVTPTGQQSGVEVGPNTTGDGIVVTNYRRRNLKFFVAEQLAGNQYKPTSKGFLSSTTGVNGVLSTLVDLVSGTVAYSPNYSPPIPLPLDPPESKKTVYQIDVVGNGIDATGPPSQISPFLENKARIDMTWYTAIKEVILPLLASFLNTEPDISQLISANTLTTAYDDLVGIVQSVWDSKIALNEGNIKALVVTVLKGVANNTTFRQSLINWYAKYLLGPKAGFFRQILVGVAQDIATSANALIAVADKFLNVYDVSMVIHDWANSNWIETWTATVVAPNVRLQPSSISIAPAASTVLQGTNGLGADESGSGTFAYVWESTGQNGQIKDNAGHSSAVGFMSTANAVTYTANSNAMVGKSDTVTMKAYIKPPGAPPDPTKWNYLGKANSTVTIAGTYTLSGDGTGNTFSVDDNLGIWLNGTVIYYDTRGNYAGPRGPYTFQGKSGDKLRIQDQDWYGFYAGIYNNVFLTTPSGKKTQIIASFQLKTKPGSQAIVFDKVFTLP